MRGAQTLRVTMTEYYIQAFVYLIAAVIAIPPAKRFGLGSVPGYLVAVIPMLAWGPSVADAETSDRPS